MTDKIAGVDIGLFFIRYHCGDENHISLLFCGLPSIR
jgi:hypothetical protein